MQAKFRFISLLILISVGIQPALSQNYLNDLEKENLKGRILSIHQYVYDASMKFGDEYKGYLKDEYIVQYNKNGNIRKIIDLNDRDTCIYIYNDKNQLIETNSNTTNITYLYDNVGRLAEVNEYEYVRGVKEFQFKTKYKYTPTEIDVTKYDHKGWPVNREIISGNEKTNSSHDTQYFDSEGQLIKETGSDMSGVFIKEYFYNGNGDIACVSATYTEYFTKKKFLTRDIYKYKYDKYGNWLEKKQYDDYDNSLTGDWIEREIVYAESEKDFDTIIASEKEAETQKHKTYTYEEVTEKPKFRGGDLNDFKKLLTEEFERNKHLILTNHKECYGYGRAYIIPSKVKFIVDYEGKIKDTSLELLADESDEKVREANIAYSVIRLISDIENPRIANPNLHEQQWTPGKMNGFNTNTLCQLYIIPKNHGSSYFPDGHYAITDMHQSFLIMNNREYEMYEKVKLRLKQVRDSIDRRNRFASDSIAKRQQFIKDSIAERQQFIKDSIAERQQFIKDSIAERQQFVAWLSNTCNSYVNYNSGRDPILYAMTGITKEQSWSLRRKDGNIKTMIRKGNTFDFTMKDKAVVSGIVFKNKIQIPFGPGEDDRITALFTEDKKFVLIFFEELDRDSMVRYYCNLVCLATQSGENTDTKVYAFPSKYRNDIMGYYRITDK